MNIYVLRGKIKGYVKTKRALLVTLLFLLLVGLGVSVVLVTQPQILEKFAQGPQVGTGTCRWQAAANIGSYRYIINDETEDKVVSEGETGGVSVDFEVTLGHTYFCAVFGVNSCGVGPRNKDTKTCGGIAPTPTPMPTATPTPKISPTPTLAPTPTPTLPPGVSPTITPTTAITHQSCRYSLCLVLPGPLPPGEQGCETDLGCAEEVVPTPTETSIPTATPTFAPGITPTATPQPTTTPQPTATPTPLAEELPESGFFMPTYLVFISGLISILGGMLLLKF